MPPPPGAGRPTETKPFLVTSEFFATLAALAALAVTAASSDSLDAGVAWPLATAIAVAYVFSRGFGKANAPSRSFDPREQLRLWDGGDHSSNVSDNEEENDQMSTGVRDEYDTRPAAPMYRRGGYGRGQMVRDDFPIETKPFFLTSEFWGSIAIIVGLAIAAGTAEDIDSRLFWILATAVTIGYVISRGIAKSGTKSRSWDPREDLMESARERVSRQGT